MMDFIETRLDLGIDYGATYNIRFFTTINAQANGSELARAEWDQPLLLIQLGDRHYDQSEVEALLTFHSATKGALNGFRIRDWSDWYAVGETLGTGNGTEQYWQLVKRYTVAGVTVTRPITKPVPGSVKIYANGILQESGWSVDTTNGKITTNLSGALTVDFEFDVPVRFLEDKLDFRFDAASNTNRIFGGQPIQITEIRVRPYSYPALDPYPDSLSHTFDLGYDYGTTGGPQFNTEIAQTASEFENRIARWDNPLGEWNIGDRPLNASELAYFIALFRVCRGQAIPFSFYDWQSSSFKSVRFSSDQIGFRFDAFRPADKQVIFNLGGISVREPPPLLVCTPRSLTLSDSLSSAWSVYSQATTGIYSGATYSLDTSGGFWRTTLGYGGDGVGYAAEIRRGNGLSYTPSTPDEIIMVTFTIDMRKVFYDGGASVPQTLARLVAIQGGNTAILTNDCGNNTAWNTYSTSLTLPFNTMAPINFYIQSDNSTENDPFSNVTTIVDYRNLVIDIDVTCPA